MDQEVVIVGADGTEHVFPAGFDPKKAAGIVRQSAAVAPQPHKLTPSGDAGGLAIKAATSAVPVASHALQELATSPSVPKIGAKIGSALGGLAPVVGGAAKGGLGGAAIGMAGVASGAWAGGKTGWFSGKLAQKLAAPVASAAEKIAPYASALGNVATVAQGGLDLAQMAEPNRHDIGFMGMSLGDKRTPEEQQAQPALLNDLANKLRSVSLSGMSRIPSSVSSTAMRTLQKLGVMR